MHVSLTIYPCVFSIPKCCAEEKSAVRMCTDLGCFLGLLHEQREGDQRILEVLLEILPYSGTVQKPSQSPA